ncbi:MAG: UDP-N-acetylmuramate dehydrogenase [Candidatus Yanofskybacteria bacterium]|nr:UDP-N-acetylmuramate dehydrogenase [Candidatus Yanofskybacteria bacterium]
MLTEEQKKELLKLAPNIKFDEPLSQHTYFKIGGPAESFLTYTDSRNTQPLKNVLKFCTDEKILFTVLGGGSNVLVSDKGLPGLVLRLDTNSILSSTPYHGSDPVTIQVAAGCPMQKLVKFSMNLGLTGLEPFLGLPGTVGGAVYNNAHFKRDQLFGSFVTKVWTIPFPLDNLLKENCYKQKDLQFGYDLSLFQTLSHKEVIFLVEVILKRDNKEEIEKYAEELLRQRKESQPLDLPSSGCVFKNPEGCALAGQIIELAGLKGLRIGGAEVSTKHANFIINPEKKATASDVLSLMAKVHGTVFELFEILLEPEIFFLGFEQETTRSLK